MQAQPPPDFGGLSIHLIHIETTGAAKNPETAKTKAHKGKTAKATAAQFFNEKLHFPFRQNALSAGA